ncbi:hypothetical protein EVJ58_g1872 [Rhodofomes roseus]|uniref:Cupin type-1 domain-containing protein n=1 Tax=Rhodofomes roseus TaxID=34475 RepID=A0A4Y9YZ92_9APHY|nr:hypothetical protein EVJ58_g1872 [Rhodofomes roseus]
MSRLLQFVLTVVLASSLAAAAPAAISASGSSVASAAEPSETVPLASEDPNGIAWNTTTDTDPQPIREQLGGTILAQQNIPLQEQNPDLLAPPTTDNNAIPNVKWPFSLSPMRLYTGGYVRQQNINQMPVASSMAGADMRLEPGAIRTSEWAYVLKGYTQITSVDQNGRNFVGTALSDWLAHTPKSVIAKNFGTSLSAWDKIPGEQLYIFPGDGPPSPDATAPEDPQGQIPNPFVYKLSEVNATQVAGGAFKIADSRNFTAATTISLAEFWVEPGGMRELHPLMLPHVIHLSRASKQAGDIGFVPASYGHYVENIGNDTLHYLEIFNSDLVVDVSLNQWLALTPPDIVKENLQISDETIAGLSKVKPYVVGATEV